MLKKYFVFTCALFFAYNITEAHASSISYTIINGATATSTSISVSTIKNRITYDCDTIHYTCVVILEKPGATTSPALKNVTLDELIEKEKNSTTTKNTYVAPIPQPQMKGVFTLPPRAVSITTSPDGKKIAYYLTEAGTVKTYSSYTLMFDNGRTLEKFGGLNKWDLVTDNTLVFGFTDDSNKLVYLDDRAGYQQLYVVDLTQEQKNLLGEPLVRKKYTVFDFLVKGDVVYFIANRAGSYTWGLFSINLTTKEFKEISPKVMYTNNLISSGDNILYVVEKDGQGILEAYNTVTQKNVSFSGITSDTVPVLAYTTLKNIHGTLITPKANGIKSKQKAIIWLHGGPYRQSAPQRHPYGSYATYDWMLDEVAKEGVTILKLDYPGSVGFGRLFSDSILGNIGKSDVEYVRKAIIHLNNIGITDIYLFGNSYGGYLSLKSLIELNTKLSGAIAAAPVTDWQKLIEQIGPTPFEAHFNGVPDNKNKKLYNASSIVLQQKKITKPIILFHGELDTQVPFSQSEYLFKTLIEAGKNITYYSVVNQAHVFNGVSQNEAMCQKVAEFIGIHSSSTSFCVLQ